MQRQQIFSRVSDIFSDVMDRDDVTLSDATTADDVEEWDSLSHVRLIVAVEQGFGIRFANAEIEGFKCLGDLVDAVKAKTA